MCVHKKTILRAPLEAGSRIRACLQTMAGVLKDDRAHIFRTADPNRHDFVQIKSHEISPQQSDPINHLETREAIYSRHDTSNATAISV